jgi:antitoxin (DNA-binding transcriptional repressor) of toxin-antitoxin stability system
VRTTIHVAKTHLSRLIQRACQGEEVVISRGDTPMVRLVPVTTSSGRRRFGAMRGRARSEAALFEPLPESELEAWEK